MIEKVNLPGGWDVSSIQDLSDVNMKSFFENFNDIKKTGEIRVMTNDISNERNVTFCFRPLKGLLNKLLMNKDIKSTKPINDLENSDIMNTISQKIGGLKGYMVKENNNLNNEIIRLEKEISEIKKLLVIKQENDA